MFVGFAVGFAVGDDVGFVVGVKVGFGVGFTVAGTQRYRMLESVLRKGADEEYSASPSSTHRRPSLEQKYLPPPPHVTGLQKYPSFHSWLSSQACSSLQGPLLKQTLVGLKVGFNVGLTVGIALGLVVGFTVGKAEGLIVGLDVGLKVGALVGFELGFRDGLSVGFTVAGTQRYRIVESGA